jgi:hypothetical protein
MPEDLMLLLRIVAVLLVLSAMPAGAAEWRRFSHPEFGFSISLPMDVFAVDENTVDRLQMSEVGGEAQLDVFAVKNPEALSGADFRAMIEEADASRRITYRAGGRTWFVLSGYLDDEAEPTIFYAKFMLSRDGTSVSAFEMGYPEAERDRYDRMVERIEDSLTAPK